MTIYVDDSFIPAKLPGMRPAIWCHLTADTKDELHAFARSIGLRRSWFQDKARGLWHYDITKTVRIKAVKAGAVEISWRDMADNPDSVWTRPGREGREGMDVPAVVLNAPKPVRGQHAVLQPMLDCGHVQ